MYVQNNKETKQGGETPEIQFACGVHILPRPKKTFFEQSKNCNKKICM
jgi:hypothetical protein